MLPEQISPESGSSSKDRRKAQVSELASTFYFCSKLWNKRKASKFLILTLPGFMWRLFGKKDKNKLPQLSDLTGNPIIAGDEVECLRYELGKCKVLLEEDQYFYESIEKGQRVSYTRMIDAITGNQKVKKVS